MLRVNKKNKYKNRWVIFWFIRGPNTWDNALWFWFIQKKQLSQSYFESLDTSMSR